MSQSLQRRTFLMATTAVLALGPHSARAAKDIAPTAEDQKLLSFFSKSFGREFYDAPEFMSEIGVKSRYGEWNDNSIAHVDEAHRNIVADTAFMRDKIDRAALSPSMRVSYDVFLFRNERRLALYPFRFHLYEVSHFGGPHSNVPDVLINRHRIADADDAKAYISRIKGVGRVMDDAVAFMREAAARGIKLPRFSYRQLIADARQVPTGAPFPGAGENVILADFKAKLSKLDIGESSKARLVRDAEQALLDALGPAYARFVAATEEIAATATTDHGVGALPNGAAFYDTCITDHTTLHIAAAELHREGLDSVTALTREMEALKAKIGFKGALRAFYEDLRTNPRYLYPSTDEGRRAYLADALAAMRKANAALPLAFNALPKAAIDVKRMESFIEGGQTIAFYTPGSASGSKPGYVAYNLAEMNALPKWQVAALAYHEGVPGHHLQVSIAQETTAIPDFRRYTRFSAFAEGWALYAEQLAKEMGLYAGDLAEVGRLTMSLWRACRLVVDTGIHVMGWSRERATDYFVANTALTREHVTREIDRHFVFPGQACAYQVGRNKILELRAGAKAALGSRFDLRAFHDALLQNGAVPLPVLESIIGEWVRSRAAPP